MDIIDVYDCTGANLPKVQVPPGARMAGYITGSGGVPWTAAQLDAHPGVVRIDQAPVNTPADETADVLDVENGAATLGDIPQWVQGARGAFHAGARPGQRAPVIYANHSALTDVANTLVHAGILDGVKLWVAFQTSRQNAIAMLTSSGGPYPIVGVQYEFNTDHDVSVFDGNWLGVQSSKPQTSHPGPGAQSGWRFCSKCQSLFFGAGELRSACARGGFHDGSQSHDYILSYTV